LVHGAYLLGTLTVTVEDLWSLSLYTITEKRRRFISIRNRIGKWKNIPEIKSHVMS
jgi:hypothetical protein